MAATRSKSNWLFPEGDSTESATWLTRAKYPDAILTFKEDGPIHHGPSPDGNIKIWKNAGSSVAFISEFTLRYDLSPLVESNA